MFKPKVLFDVSSMRVTCLSKLNLHKLATPAIFVEDKW